MKTKNFILALWFICLGLILNACDNSNSGSNLVYQGELAEKLIEANEGGTVSCTSSDGAVVTLRIPSKALNESVKVKLKVATANESVKAGPDTLYCITTEPEALQLFEAAYLQIEFPDSVNEDSGIILFSFKANNEMLPLKQNTIDGTIKGSLYGFGDYECSRFDIGLCYEISDGMQSAEIPYSWQELLGTFNGLVWLGNYFHKNGELEDAIACFNSVIEISGRGIDNFLEIAAPIAGKELEKYKKSLDKYKYIQKLCSDQEIQLKNIDNQ